MIPKNIAEEVLSAALMSGGDFSELYVEDSVSHSISLLDGKVENAGCSHSRGAGVRVFSGVKSAYAYTNGTDREDLIATAKAAAAALQGTDTQDISVFVPKNYAQPMEIPFSEIDNAARIRLAKEAHLAAKSESAEITQVKAGYMDIAKKVLICNSEGVWAEDLRPRTRLYVEAVASDGSEVQTGT
ncbi:MAG: TldD/PmbA family protein, partial [Clostridia bacterium]|nr:TldD/PmbA family protein [Clostridia bacterium]